MRGGDPLSYSPPLRLTPLIPYLDILSPPVFECSGSGPDKEHTPAHQQVQIDKLGDLDQNLGPGYPKVRKGVLFAKRSPFREKDSFSRKGPNFTKRTKETGIGLVFTNYFIVLKVKYIIL